MELLLIFGLLVTFATGEVLAIVPWRKAALDARLQPSAFFASQEGAGPAAMAPSQWAEMQERKDAVWYQSGSAGQRAQAQSKEEKEKERRSWDMLHGLVIEEGRTREPSLPSPPSGLVRKPVK
jgi:hypothetical protein